MQRCSHKARSVLEKKIFKGKKVKRQRTTILLAILVDLSSPIIHATVQPQGIFGSGEEEF